MSEQLPESDRVPVSVIRLSSTPTRNYIVADEATPTTIFINVINASRLPAQIIVVSFFCCLQVGAVSRIGFILPETGRYADIAVAMRPAIEIAWQEAFDSGNTLPLEYEFIDNFNHPDSAQVRALELAERSDILAIAGGYPSECCFSIIDVAESHELPYLIISSSADSLTCGDRDFVFRLAPPTADYNDGLVGWAVSHASSKRGMAILYDDHSLWGKAVDDLCFDLQDKWRGRVERVSFQAGERDFSSRIGNIMKLKPGLVWLLGSWVDIAGFLKQCGEVDAAPAAFALGTVGQMDERFTTAAESSSDYIYAPAVWWYTHPYPGVDKFVKRYKLVYGTKPDYHAAEAFAAVQVLIDAFNRIEEPSRNNFRTALEHTNVSTVFGEVRFEDYLTYRNQNRVKTTALQLQGETWQVVWPQYLATAGSIYPMPDWSERQPVKSMNKSSYFVLLLMIVLIWIMMSGVARKRRALRKQ